MVFSRALETGFVRRGPLVHRLVFLDLALRCADRLPMLGHQPELVGAIRLYVVPNPSPANAHFTLTDQTAWYDRLAEFLAAVRPSD